MKHDFLSEFIGSPHRARITRALLLNENEVFTSESIGKRAGVTARVAERELKSLERIGVAKSMSLSKSKMIGIKTQKKGHSKNGRGWMFDAQFKHARPLSLFVRDISPVHYDQIVDALKKSGKLSAVVLSGSFMGDMTRPTDILVAADILNERRLEGAVRTLEPVFGRELRYAGFSTPEFRYRLTVQDRLIRDTLDYPHLVLLDRAGIM